MGYTGSINKYYFLAKGLDTPILLKPLFSAINYTDNAQISYLVAVTNW